jgi:hypothetical protein
MMLIAMKIGPQPAVTPNVAPAQTDAMRQQYQARVLKKALDSQQQAAEKLLNLLDPKGKVLDIRA